jgi:hypothetical protein
VTVRGAGKPFNPLTLPRPLTREPIKSRPEGGPGIVFVKDLMGGVAYDGTGERNTLTLTGSVALM